MTTRQRDEEQTGTYRELIGIAEEVVESARMALEKTSKTRGKDMLAGMAIEEIRKDIQRREDLLDLRAAYRSDRTR